MGQEARKIYREEGRVDGILVVLKPVTQYKHDNVLYSPQSTSRRSPGSTTNLERMQLANVENKSTKVLNRALDGILKDYSDVFPDDLPVGLPKQRAVDHRIETLPDAIPPSKAAYRVSPAESEELRKQLDDLLKHCLLYTSRCV